MKQPYSKPALFNEKEPARLIPVVAGIAAVLGVSQAVAGLALGAAATGAAVGGGVALAKKLGENAGRWERLPSFELVETGV
ncbi:MAG: hypothetical protein LBG90_06755 [Spirochaetaceae bacterium]|jgi:hypothetical protein|nr:hypothetical protein [Spirochaetaceae bacterium]